MGSYNLSVVINPGSTLLSNSQSIMILYFYYFNKPEFERALNEILTLKVIPYNNEMFYY